MLWKLTYLSILDGQRHTYMNIGFESPEAAEQERDKLQREYEKRWAQRTDDEIRQMYLNGIKMYTAMIAREYKIEPIKLRKVL